MNKRITLAQLKKVHTVEDLNNLGIGKAVVDISHRGGGLGLKGDDVANYIGVLGDFLPRNYGAGCNYLGGGVRGAVFASGYNKEFITGAKAKWLDELADACKRAYVHTENGMNDEEDENGEINWDAKATNASRKAGIISSY